jgi:integration host factor subunit alpha
MPSTLTRSDLTNSVYEEIGLSRVESSNFVDAVFQEMEDAIVADGVLKISSFGTFQTRKKKARVGRNPKTGVETTITPRTVVTFKASNLLKERMNDGA